MPRLPGRPCPVAGCPVIGPCPTHQRTRQPGPVVPTPRLYDDRRGSSAQRGYGYAWQKRRKEFIEAHPYCARCGRPTKEVDHKLPRRLGGSDDDSNLQGLCSWCHKSKTAREKKYLRGVGGG